MFDWNEPGKISTIDLVEVTRWKDDGDQENETVAKQAGEVFFQRFGPDLLKSAEILCEKNGRASSDALIITQRAIRKFIHSTTFNFEKSKVNDPDKAVKIYLNRIVRNELVNLHREEVRKANYKYTGNEGLVYELEDLGVFKEKLEPTGKLKKYLELIDHILRDVNPTHKMIFLTYMDANVQPGERPPPHLVKLLEETTGLSRITIKGVVNDIRKRIKPIWDVYSKEK